MHRIAVIPGDGIGPEVIREGLKVIEVAAQRAGFEIEAVEYDLGAERYLRTGEVLPDSVLEELKGFEAIYFGAIGDPRVPPGVLERGLLLRLRFSLDLYINLRPARLYPGLETPLKGKGPKEIDFVVVRENTEDLYIGAGGFAHKGTNNEVAMEIMVATRRGVERCVRFAFELAMRRRKRVALVDKANVLVHSHDLWRRVFFEVGEEYPEVEREALFVDAACIHMVERPERFDVIVTPNMFGDILTDLAASIAGGIGVAPSGNIHPGRVSMFEPVHGSAPDIAGKGVANPLAAILAGAMMLEHLGEWGAARLVERGVEEALRSGRIRPGRSRTWEIGDAVADMVATLPV
ncbi:MAG TPA: 3-isopropylmalate dehydrogenase [Armatimonadetes bacterium]|nr:3-isopropylmalate dehydrogenase [Armatimonadota bacterium]